MITQLKNANEEPNAELVEMLEEHLEMAKRGELRSVVLVGAMIGHETRTSWVTKDAIEAVGQLELLKRDLLEACPRR